jgi:hypothetical protein
MIMKQFKGQNSVQQ